MDKLNFKAGIIIGIVLGIIIIFFYHKIPIYFNEEQLNKEIAKCIKEYPNNDFEIIYSDRNKNINTYIKQLNYSCYKLEYIKENCLNPK